MKLKFECKVHRPSEFQPQHPCAKEELACMSAMAENNLQGVHDEEERGQEGGCEEEAARQQPRDACRGGLGRESSPHEEVEGVTQRPCEKEPEARGGAELDTPILGPASHPNPRP